MNAPLCIEGRIVIDPRQRYTRSQERPVCHLHVLLTRREEAAPTVVEVILFDEDALRCSRDLKMGARVLIEGDACGLQPPNQVRNLPHPHSPVPTVRPQRI